MQTKLNLLFDRSLKFNSERFSPVFAKDADFWRLHLDYCKSGMNNDLGVYSHSQTPDSVENDGKLLTVKYSKLVAEDKTVHNISLVVKAERTDDGAIKCSASITNNEDIRVNELQYPFIELERIDGDLSGDLMYRPLGLGEKIENPHDTIKEKSHTEYMCSDYKNIWNIARYPGFCSMPWYGIQSGKTFLYIGRHDETCRLTTLVTGTEPREDKTPRIIMTLSSYPAVLQGETVEYGGFVVAAFDKDWRDGADYYRRWADNTWWKEKSAKKNVVKLLDGWQRIILKHQFGEIFHTYKDIPGIYREGAKYGIKMVLLFAWWKEGMDNGYPNYMPDEVLGGAEELRRAIKEVNDEGGTVILYANGHLIDVSTDYYKTEGYKYTMKDIELNEYREEYRFANNGTILKFRHKTFVGGCYGTEAWRNKVLEIEDRHLSLGSNGSFFDQIGICMELCFDRTHDHGARIDLDSQYRIDTVKEMRKKIGEDEMFGTEWAVDRLCPYMDFIHGCGNAMTYYKGAFPCMFRYTFPEVPVSNRFIHDEKAEWKTHLNYAFAHGLIFDVSIYRGRAKGFEIVPEYEKQVKKLVDLREQYREYFVDGRYDLPETQLPENVSGAEYTYNGKKILALYNAGTEDAVFKINGNKAVVPAIDVKVFEI